MCASLRVSQNPMAKQKQRCGGARAVSRPGWLFSTELILISHFGDSRKLRVHICVRSLVAER